MRLRELRALFVGEAGLRLAVALGAVAALTAFVAAAGPREVAATQTSAARNALAALPVAQTTMVATADWYPNPGQPSGWMTQAQQAGFGAAMARQFPPQIISAASGRRAFVSGPFYQVPTAAQSATTSQLPQLQLSYDSGLPADARLISGHWPGPPHQGLPGHTAADRKALVLEVAATQANAARFGLRPGSLQDLGVLSGQSVWLEVTAVVQPRSKALFWGSSAGLPTPYLEPPGSDNPYWVGGVIVGQADLVAMQSVELNTDMHGQWYFPIAIGRLESQQLGPLATAVTFTAGSSAAVSAARQIKFKFVSQPVITTQLPGLLTTIQAQLSATSGIDSLVIVGLFVAGLLLMLLSAGIAADRYEAELALTRARGASLWQITRRAAARSVFATGPAMAIAIWLATLIGTGSTSPTAVLLPALTALIAIASVPVRCTWRVRKSDSARAAQRTGLTEQRRSPRRVVTEVSVLLVAVGAVVALRARGLQSGGDQFGVISPVLVAIAASIAVGRLYPIPVRALLPLSAGRRGPVGFLGMTKVGRSGLATMLPALALVLTLTLAAFGWMLTKSVASGQIASSWSQSGADAVVVAPGNGVVGTSTQRAFDALKGVRHTALVYTAIDTSQSAPSLISPGGQNVPLGLAVVDPGPYAALSGGTPWSKFPASELAKRAGPVPILISASAATVPGVDAALGSRQTLELDGINMPVRIVGSIGATAAFPAGGPYVVMPQWAVGTFPSIPGPSTLLVTGPSASPVALAALAAHDVRGGQVILRANLLHAQRTSAAEYAVRLFVIGSWAAALLSVVALLFGLAATAQSRRTLRTRMAGLGMSSGQASALALFDPVSLLTVAVVGMVAAGAALSLISRQVINLAALTSSTTPTPVSLDLLALVVPAAAIVVLALIMIAGEHALASRGESATALRFEEAG